MIVDIETATTKVYDPPIDPKKMDFYIMVLPPVPRRHVEGVYKDEQAWWSAHYHASNDGYGM